MFTYPSQSTACSKLLIACHYVKHPVIQCIFFPIPLFIFLSFAFSPTAIPPINPVSPSLRFCLQRFPPSITNQQIALHLPCCHDRFLFLHGMNPVMAGANQLAFRYLLLYHTICPHSMARCMTASSEQGRQDIIRSWLGIVLRSKCKSKEGVKEVITYMAGFDEPLTAV